MLPAHSNSPSPPSTAGVTYRCSTCARAYSRSSHLRRHELTHSSQKLSQCPFCSRWFAKTETARRHAISCARKHNAAIPSEKKRGRKARSCDRCARYKVSCDAGAPCAKCRSMGAACSYQRLLEAETEGANTGEKTGTAAPFLFALTDPSYSCSAEAFAAIAGQDDAGAAAERHCVAADGGNSSASARASANHQQQALFLEPEALFLDWDPDNSLLGSNLEPVWHLPCRPPGQLNSGSSSSAGSSHPLAIRLHDVVSQLSATHSRMVSTSNYPSASRSASDFDMTLAKSVFTADNLAEFSRAYFNRFNSQMPIVHRSSFKHETASPPLLLAVFAAGAVCAVPSDHALSARMFLDIIEEHIFSQHIFRQYLQQQKEEVATEQSAADGVEVLQAAIIVSSLQASMHSTATRRRIRVQRCPCLVAVIRSLGLPAAKRRAVAGLSWRDFIVDEIRLRLAVYTFLHASYLSMFFNHPPLMLVSEMTGDLPCTDELFEVDTASGFESLLASPGQGITVWSLNHLLAVLMQDPWPQAQELLRKNCVTARHLALAISALHSSAFIARTSPFGLDSLSAIFRATERWKGLWDVATQSVETNQTPHTGFLKHAAEICWLVRAVVQSAQAGDLSCSYMRLVATDSLTELHEFIQKQKTRKLLTSASRLRHV